MIVEDVVELLCDFVFCLKDDGVEVLGKELVDEFVVSMVCCFVVKIYYLLYLDEMECFVFDFFELENFWSCLYGCFVIFCMEDIDFECQFKWC